eukprot:tig00000249_g22155.t1
MGAAYGGTAWTTVPRQCDLLHRVYLVLEVGPLVQTPSDGVNYWHWTNKLGLAMWEKVVISIGGAVVQEIRPEHIDLQSALSVDEINKPLAPLIGDWDWTPGYLRRVSNETQRFIVPLPTWTRLPQTAHPVMGSPDIKVAVTFRPLKHLVMLQTDDALEPIPALDRVLSGQITDAYLLCNFIYLDEPEKTQVNRPFERLVETWQTQEFRVPKGSETFAAEIRLTGPCKELLFVFREFERATNGRLFDYEHDDPTPDNNADPATLYNAIPERFKTLSLTLRGNERVPPLPPTYYKVVTPREVHGRVPDRDIFCLPFCLDADTHRPTGSLNLGTVDQILMNFTFASPGTDADLDLLVYAVGFNVMRQNASGTRLLYQ